MHCRKSQHDEGEPTSARLRGLLKEIEAALGNSGLREYFPQAGIGFERQARIVAARAQEVPDSSSRPEPILGSTRQFILNYAAMLEALATRGPRSHDPMVIKYLGARVQRIRRFVEKLDVQRPSNTAIAETTLTS